MNVGVYFDLRNPPPWRQDWSRLYGFTLEMCEEADRLGAHSVWVSEHHLFEDGYLNQPLTYAAAIAARTRSIRIGTAILIAPFRSAVHLAEEAAVVDLVSDGRLDLGLGAGYRLPEFGLYEAVFSRRYEETEQRVREIRALWAQGALMPPPVQAHLPIWLGYTGPKGARRAGRLGEGLLVANPELVEPYREGLADGGHDPASARMAGVVGGFITEDPEGDWPVVARHLAYQWNSYRRYMVEGTGRPAPKPIDPDQWRARGVGAGFDNFLLATPGDAAKAITDFLDGTPVETVFFWASLAGMPEAMVTRHIQTICGPLRAALAATSEPD
jgi:alkanesulfonate monooxygenase SsuD/methylene tetrahydromethanopterin reductase-like flavin-dependent oxidoreductase (luciferase family)